MLAVSADGNYFKEVLRLRQRANHSRLRVAPGHETYLSPRICGCGSRVAVHNGIRRSAVLAFIRPDDNQTHANSDQAEVSHLHMVFT